MKKFNYLTCIAIVIFWYNALKQKSFLDSKLSILDEIIDKTLRELQIANDLIDADNENLEKHDTDGNKQKSKNRTRRSVQKSYSSLYNHKGKLLLI